MLTRSSSSPFGYMPHVDGLRGLAVLVIVLFHFDFTAFGGGYVGVDIFFVISGFLITSIITRQMAESRFSFARFYARRIRRIFPALFATLFLCSLAALLFLGLREYSAFFESLRKASAQISNFHFAGEVDYFALGHELSPLLHTWSLGVEEQFYLLWPLMLFLTMKYCGRRYWPWVLAAVSLASLGLSEYLVRTAPMQAFYMLHSRAWELGLGSLLALNIVPPPKRRLTQNAVGAAGIVCILIAVFTYDESHFPGLKAVLPCLGSVLFIYSALAGAADIHKIFSLRPVVFTGLISYSLYLWHWPVVAFYKSYFGGPLTPGLQAGFILASFLLATGSYYFVETPFRRLKAAHWKFITAGLLAIVLFIVYGNVMKRYNDANWRVDYEMTDHIRDPHALDKICSVEGGAFDRERCILGPDKDGYEVILAGDSHASHYTPMVLAWAKDNGLTVRLMIRGACKAWIRKDTHIRGGAPDPYCDKLSREFYETLGRRQSVRYVFLGLSGPDDSAEIRRSLKEISSYGPQAYFLGQVAVFEDDPHACMIKNHLFVRRWFPRKQKADCMTPDAAYFKNHQGKHLDDFKALLKQREIPYFDPAPHMTPPFDEQGRFLYMDNNHLNRYGARYLSAPFAAFMRRHANKAD